MCFGNSNYGQGQAKNGAQVDQYGNPASPAPAPQTIPQQITSQEDARQASVRAGNSSIESAFSKFNDPYFADFEKSFKDYYNPQIDTQYNDAQGTLEAGLARKGVDRSSIAATQFGRLFGQYSDQREQIGDQAASAAGELRGKVANEKSSLYALNSASANPAQANTEALARSTALVTPPAYTPLGSVFANFLSPYTAYSQAYSNNAGAGYKSPYQKNNNSGAVVQ